MANTPKIRFNGHQDDWKEKKLGTELKNTPYKHYIKAPNTNGKYPIIQQGDHPILGYANGQPFTKYEDKVVFGDHTVSLYKPQSPFFAATDGLRIFSMDGVSQSLLYAIFERFKPKSRGYTRHTSYLNECNFSIPKEQTEQQQIGEFFAALDELIGAKEQELEKLRQMKQALLEKMFPCEDNNNLHGGGNSQIINLLQDYNLTISTAPNTPQIRFRGFTEPWEIKRLGDIGKMYNGLSGKNKNDFGHGQAQYITYMNVFSNTLASPSGIDHIEVDEKQNRVCKGDILFTVSSETPDEVGMSSVWLYDVPHTYLNSFCFGFRPTIDMYPLFSAFVMRSPNVRKAFYILAQGISRFNISKQKAMEIKIAIPSYEEQQMIGNFFRAQDNAINAAKEQIQKLIILKQALLDKMFAA